ncbi:MAG: hypothetical protein ACFCVD_03315 [Nodosilinea sp.]
MQPQKYDYSKLALLDKLYFGPLWLAERLLNDVVSTLASTEDVSIRQGRDRHGNLVFNVRDRTSGQQQVFSSEDDLRAWLDQRYYRDARPTDLDWTYPPQRWLR